MKVEVWSDIVCPWCYIGKRHMEAALGRFADSGQIDIEYRSFQLDPSAPKTAQGDSAERLAKKYNVSREEAVAMQSRVSDTAAQAGLTYHLDKTKPANTFDAHRLLHLAKALGVQERLKERLMSAYFSEGLPVGDAPTLIRLAGDVGIPATHAERVLSSDEYGDDVRGDIEQAHKYGITGVPFFVIDKRFGIPGAQPADVILETLNQAWAEVHASTPS